MLVSDTSTQGCTNCGYKPCVCTAPDDKITISGAYKGTLIIPYNVEDYKITKSNRIYNLNAKKWQSTAPQQVSNAK